MVEGVLSESWFGRQIRDRSEQQAVVYLLSVLSEV